MRSVWPILVLILAGCGRAEPARPAAAPLPSSAPADEPPPRVLSVGELGAEGVSAEWIELQMPADARVLGYQQDAGGARETWTIVEASQKRLLRIRHQNGSSSGQASWVGTKTKDGMELRLVEVRGRVRFAPERLTVTCAKDRICEDGKPMKEITASMCVFEDGDGAMREVAWFLPGKGVDFPIGACRTENTTRERYLKSPLRGLERARGVL